MEPLQEDDNLVDYTHELDLTNHHENIASGIKSIKQLYNLSSSGAKAHVESAYIEKITKFPQILPVYQEKAAKIKSLLSTLPKDSKVTEYTFTMLKCNHCLGIGWIEIEGLPQNLTLSLIPPTFNYPQNNVSEFSYKNFASQNQEIARTSVNLWKRLAKLNSDQIAYCSSLVLFENFKNEMVDCSFWVNLELSAEDRRRILETKYKENIIVIEKLRIDSQDFTIKSQFKSGCCDCTVV